MTDKALPAGWVIQVTVLPPRGEARWIGPTVLGAPSFQYFNVAIAAAETAIEATTKQLAKNGARGGEMHAIRGLSSGELATLHLKAGEVKAA